MIDQDGLTYTRHCLIHKYKTSGARLHSDVQEEWDFLKGLVLNYTSIMGEVVFKIFPGFPTAFLCSFLGFKCYMLWDVISR